LWGTVFFIQRLLKTANKIVSLILAGILLLSIIGVSINEHYCLENEVITSIGIQNNIPCTCEIPMQDDCCNDVSTFYAFNGFYNLAQATVSSQPSFEVIEPIQFKLVAIANQSILYNVVKDTSNPLAESNLYLKIQSFLL